MKEKNALFISRVSTEKQDQGSSPEAQKAWHDWLEMKEKLNVIKRIHETISGVLFPRKHFDEFINLTQEKGVDVLATHKLDRFSRSLEYGSMLLLKMHETHPLKIFTSNGKYDYSISSDRSQVKMQLYFADHEQGTRFENVERSMEYMLKNGWYPYPPPFGLFKDKNNKYKKKKERDHSLFQKPWCFEVLNYLFNTFENEKNFYKSANKTNEKFPDLNLELTSQKVKKILQNKVYVGYLPWDGEEYGCGDNNQPWENLKIISEEKFNSVQLIINKIDKKYNRNDDNIVFDLIDEYGIDPVLNVLPVKIACRDCGSINKTKNGTGENRQIKFYCKKCGKENRFPLRRDIKKIEKLVSKHCPKCGTTDNFSLINDGSTIWQLKCKNCGSLTLLYNYIDSHKVQHKQEYKKESNVKKSNCINPAQLKLSISDGHDMTPKKLKRSQAN